MKGLFFAGSQEQPTDEKKALHGCVWRALPPDGWMTRRALDSKHSQRASERAVCGGCERVQTTERRRKLT